MLKHSFKDQVYGKLPEIVLKRFMKKEDEEAIRRTRFFDSDPNIRIKAMKAKPKYKRK